MKTSKVKGQANVAHPYDIPDYEPADIYAIQALIAGDATDAQQRRFVRWLEVATAVGEMSYRPASDRDTAFAEGKRFVGLQFFTLAKAVLPQRDSQPAAPKKGHPA